ncbi:MAG: hypothetical protein ACLFV6_03430 [Spirulinaceae cyanobacterium]
MRLTILLLSFSVTISTLTRSVPLVSVPVVQHLESHQSESKDPIVPPYRS